MKKLLIFLFILFSTATNAVAKDYTFTNTRGDTAVIKTTNLNATITVTKGGPVDSRDVDLAVYGKDSQGKYTVKVRYAGGIVFGNPRTPQNFNVINLTPSTTYRLGLLSDGAGVEKDYFLFETEAKAPDVVVADFEVLKILQAGSSVGFAGRIPEQKYPDFKKFKALLHISQTKLTTDLSIKPGDTKEYISHQEPKGGAGGIADDGRYYWQVTELAPKTEYFYREILTPPSGASIVRVGSFNSTDAHTLSKSEAADQKNFNDRSYRLLAPFPGLAVLLDPDLCAEQRAVGKVGQICDINDFLNYGLSLLIGVSAVVLVFRLMYEGYRYIVTDVPFLKMNAKSKFGEALLGLLLALSAFLILNTINPKLVSNEIAIDGVYLGVDNFEGVGDFNFAAIKNLGKTGVISCPITGGQASIASIAESYVGKVSYNQNRRNTVNGGDIYLDCSSYAATVLNCAGIKTNVSSTTETFFGNTGSEKINKNTTDLSKNVVNGVTLKPGDLIGWRVGDKVHCNNKGECSGHVLVYIGNGNLAEVHGPTYPGSGRKNGAARTIGLNTYTHKEKFRYIKRL